MFFSPWQQVYWNKVWMHLVHLNHKWSKAKERLSVVCAKLLQNEKQLCGDSDFQTIYDLSRLCEDWVSYRPEHTLIIATKATGETVDFNRTSSSQTSYVPDSSLKQTQLLNCKNMVSYNPILNSQLCCSPAVFISVRVVKLSLLTAHIS